MTSSIVASQTFATRARTIDHLGREQIADCPTAVSELWKNSWDAYSRNVRLRIFPEEAPVAVLTDDGHGMRQRDLFERWLVIGTESKISDAQPTPPDDRNGLPIRARQGQKGIGRLSSAKLGSILLLISKHRKEDYVAALIDWRMFENPYVNLSEVAVAAGSFATKHEIFASLSVFADVLVASVLNEVEGWRGDERLTREAWRLYDESWSKESSRRTGLVPSKRILQGMKRLPFRLDHLADWEGPGTAMLVYDLDDTLKALPATGDTDPVREEVNERFERTLSNFVDPFAVGPKRPEFSYRAEVVSDGEGKSRPKVIVGAEKAIDRTQIQEMEHQIEGTVGDDGIFRGRLKAFGAWIDGKIEFDLPKGLMIPERANSRVGPFEIYIASMEFEPDNSTHPRSEHNRYADLAKEYSGLMIYRDGLRVLPYGREDNDFFEIESKRSKNAGRYFWNHRQMFGRISGEDYQELVREAFIQPIRSVLIVDDDYPTLHETLLDDDEREKKYAHKEWRKAEVREKMRKVIEQFRTPSSPYLLDIHDGSSPSEETDEKQVKILHQTDLLILDYQLEKEKENDGSAAVRIAREALLNKHFNLILVHTQETLERVFYEFLFGVLKPIYLGEEQIAIEESLQTFLDGNEDALIGSVSSSQYAAARLGGGGDLAKLDSAIREGTAPWGAVKSVLEAGGLNQATWIAAVRYALELFEENNKILFSQEDLGVTYWSDGDIKFIRAARGFVAFKSKDDPEELMATMHRALVAWDPRPPRLMLTKLRAEMNERGIEVQDDALGQPEVGAIWYRNLLKADERNLDAMIDRTVRNHAEQLLDKLLPNVSQFAARIRAVDADRDLLQVIRDRFKINLQDADTLSEARMGHNAFVGSKPIKSSHLEIGHILRIGDDYWVCLTPACDMVPKVHRGEPYDKMDGVKRFVAVKLIPKTIPQGLKSANHGGHIFVNLILGVGKEERRAFAVAKDSKASPTWMTMYVQDDGYLPSAGELICKVSYMTALTNENGEIEPGIKIADAVVCGMLRYEYALEVQSKFVASQSRIGLDFEST